MRKLAYFIAALALLVVFVVAGLYLYLAPASRSAPVIAKSTLTQTESGEIIGFVDDGVSTWLGIPYAAPPAGELRWRAPRPPVPWEGTRQALTFGDACPQRAQGNIQGSEDCLFVNVWSPDGRFGEAGAGHNREPGRDTALPVMFWIHGGGNSIGESSTSIYSGARLSREHNLVLVSLNYRLGPLGWFRHTALHNETSTPADDSGNYGTLDIMLALQWVQNNIARFGGDPDNVTIFGESAGGFDVLTMMASPLARNLFHRAISQSGGLNLTSVEVAENYSDDANPGHRLSSREIVNQMLIDQGRVTDRDSAKQYQEKMDPFEISAALHKLSPAELIGLYTGSFGGMLGNPDIFADGFVLPSDLKTNEIFSNPDTYNAVPVMLGTNRDEIKLFMAFSSDTIDKTFGLPSGFNDLARYNRDNRYGTDSWKIRGVDDLASAMSQAGNRQVFAYRFDVDDWRNLGFINLKDLFGAAHALEVPFVFGNFPKPLRVIFPDSMKDEFNLVSSQMRAYWAEFAYTGSPGRGRSGQQIEWQPWDNSENATPRLMVFDTESDQKTRMVSDRLATDDLRQRLIADTSYRTQEAHCAAYKNLFRGDAFVEQEYLDLGESGCSN